MRVSGHATTEGTGKYRNRMTKFCIESHFHEVLDLWWSTFGVGTYLGAPDRRTDQRVAEAITRAIKSGINVIDSAINYRRQHAERSVGEALKMVIDGRETDRSEIIICTKGGFLPHPDGPKWFKKEYCGGPDSGITLNDLAANCHCMHPAYLSDQMERSRENLGLETIDVYYVHKPETQRDVVEEDVFYSRIGAAFRMLEKAVADGKICFYGLATWSAFLVPEGNARHVSLEKVKEIARSVAGKGGDHFRFIQLPLNIMMLEAVAVPTQRVGGEVLPAIPAAGRLGIHPVLSASISQGDIAARSRTLKDSMEGRFESDFQRALQFSRSAPGAAAALIGMKKPKHVSENLKLCQLPPISPTEFETIINKLR